MARKLFEDVKVADFTWALVGPITTKYLSDYGAKVIKVEGRTHPDSRRASGPFKDDVSDLDRSGGSNPFSTGKLSLGLNLAHPKGLEVAKKLVVWADVVVDNFAGGTMERMGLGYDVLSGIKPDIIMVSSSTMGQTGPYAGHRGAGLALTALAGFNYIAGWPDRDPAALAFYTDFIAPYFNIITVLAALDYRRRTGRGQYFDLSQYENSMHFMAPLVLDFLLNGRVACRRGNRCDHAAPHGAYRCKGDDRWCSIAVFNEMEWAAFCRVTGYPKWSMSRRFGNVLARKKHEDELDKLVEAWTIDHSAEEVMTLMQSAGVAAGIVENVVDLLQRDPQLEYRQFWSSVAHPEVGNYIAWRPPFLLSEARCELQRAPLLGEHNEYVCKEILGMSDEQIAELIIEGILE